MAAGDLAAHHGGHVAVSRLEQASSSGRQIVGHPRRVQPQAGEVDDVEVTLLAGLDHPAVVQPVEGGGVVGLLLDHIGQGQTLPPAPVAGPVGQQERRDRRVADQAAVRSPIGEARYPGRVGQHVPDGIVVAVGEVEERQHQQGPPLLLEEQVVQLGEGVHAVGPGEGGDVRSAVGS